MSRPWRGHGRIGQRVGRRGGSTGGQQRMRALTGALEPGLTSGPIENPLDATAASVAAGPSTRRHVETCEVLTLATSRTKPRPAPGGDALVVADRDRCPVHVAVGSPVECDVPIGATRGHKAVATEQPNTRRRSGLRGIQRSESAQHVIRLRDSHRGLARQARWRRDEVSCRPGSHWAATWQEQWMFFPG